MSNALEFIQGGIGLGIGLLIYLVLCYSLWSMANKRKLENAWFSWIPILDLIIMLQLAGEELWKIILCLIPCVNIIYGAYMWWKIAESQGKPGPIGILAVIPCVNIFAIPYIAFAE